MRTRVQRWGNSLAVRIPKSFALEIGLHDDACVDLSMRDGALVIAPRSDLRLEDLLAGVTDANTHAELDWGPAVGREAW